MNLLFDFDGTLADSFPLNMEIFLELRPKYNLSPQTEAAIAGTKEMTAKQIFAKSGLSLVQLPFFLKDSQAIIAKKMHLVKPFEGIVETLQKLHQAGHVLGIVTSNSIENVNLFLDQHHLTELFAFVHSEKNLWGKAVAFKHVMAEQNLDIDQTFYLGDETRDIEAAHEAGLKIIAVGWGFNSAKFLQTAKPDFLIEKPTELLSLVN